MQFQGGEVGQPDEGGQVVGDYVVDGLAALGGAGGAPNPRFFSGFLTTPQAAAVGLLAVAEVARTCWPAGDPSKAYFVVAEALTNV
ncbi:hypothetical protein BSA16_04295, partial [Micromonospora sp. Rc5]